MSYMRKWWKRIFVSAWVIGIVLTFQTGTVTAGAANEESSGATSFGDLYSSAQQQVSKSSQSALIRDADAAASAKRFVEATATYLAVAEKPLAEGNFERARPFLDKLFLAAAATPAAEQKQMLQALSLILSNARDRDYDSYKYLAQQRLKLLSTRPGSTAVDRYHEVQTLAFSCSRHKRYKEAETLLLATLTDLQAMNPQPEAVGQCEQVLARVYEDSGQLDLAKRYWDSAASFAKENPERRHYTDTLQSQLHFLLKAKMFKEALPVADAFYIQATSPEYKRWRNRVSFAMMAREFADVNLDEANKYYRAAFENQIEGTKTAMNMGYGTTVAEWAAMLHRHGKTSEAISVLQEGMAFCRTVKWPRSFDQYMPEMVNPCEEYLRASHRNIEADKLRADFEKEKAARHEDTKNERTRWLNATVANLDARPSYRVEALTELSYHAFDDGNCQEGKKYLDQAVDAYEKNATGKDSATIYSRFNDISARLKKCGMQNESKEMLLRIIKARMVEGFVDPNRILIGCTMGMRHIPVQPLEDYCQLPGGDENMKELLALAKASNKPVNVVCVMSRINQSQHPNEMSSASLEEMEVWRAKQDDPSLLYESMLKTAQAYIQEKKYQKAEQKWKEALAMAQKSVSMQTQTTDAKRPNRFRGWRPQAMSIANIGRMFESADRFGDAGEVYLAAYKIALQEPREYSSQMQSKNIEQLALKYRNAGDTAAGTKLLNEVLNLSKQECGDDSLQVRSWLLKIADYYAEGGQKDLTKDTCARFMASINKPGMTVSKTTTEAMIGHSKVLKEHGFKSEADRVDKKLAELDKLQCADPASHHH